MAETDRPETERAPAPELVPPVQLMLQCPECGYERTTLALHPNAIERSRTCERCSRPTKILAYRPMHNGCSCCAL